MQAERISSQPPLEDEIGENEAALFDAFVVPTYLMHFADRARELLLVGEAGRLVHLGCRSGYPEARWLQDMPRTLAVGVDSSTALLELARSKADGAFLHYLRAAPEQSGLDAEAFSHGLTLHPLGGSEERVALFAEIARLLYGGGQALVALPLGHSFLELTDLLSEYALKHEDSQLEAALEATTPHRPTLEQIQLELEGVGLSDIDVLTHIENLAFDSGRAFANDPAVQALIWPQLTCWLGGVSLEPARDYVAKAIDKYWSEASFELTVHIAALSARK